MKKLIFTSIILLSSCLFSFAQDLTALVSYKSRTERNTFIENKQELRFNVNGVFSRPVKKQKITTANSLIDIIPDYPVNWIKDYISVEIYAICYGQVMKARSTNTTLTAEQKSILHKADVSTDLIVNVNYKTENSATGNLDNHTMHAVVTVIPDFQAEFIGYPETSAQFPGHYPKLIDHLEKNWKENIPDPQRLENINIMFTIDEEGKVINAKVHQSSGYPDIDNYFLDRIYKMPLWMPAKNADGKKVRQSFQFSAGKNGC